MASSASLYSTTVASATGSTWTNTANATGSTAATFATFTSATNGAQGLIQLSGYGAQAATNGGVQPSSISSVDVTIKSYVASTARWSGVTVQLFAGTTAIGSPTALTLSTTTTNSQTVRLAGANAPTWAQLSDLRVQVVATKTGTQSSTYNLDYAGVVVNWPGVGEIDGIEPEAVGHVPPFVDGNGNLYRLTEEFLADGNNPIWNKSTDGGISWAPAGVASQPSGGGWNDLESGWVIQVGTTLVFVWTDDASVFYTTFNTSDAASNPDTWQLLETGITGLLAGSRANASAARLSDGRVRVVFQDSLSGSNNQLAYITRSTTTGAPSWTAKTALSTTTDNFLGGGAVTGAGNTVHVFTHNYVAKTILWRTISSADVVSANTRVDTATTNTVSANFHAISNPVYYDNSGAEVVSVLYAAASGLRCIQLVNGVATDTQVTANNPSIRSGPGSDGPFTHLAVDGTTLHAIWADDTSGDLMYATKAHGAAWSTPTVLWNSGAGEALWCHNNVYTRAGTKYMGYTVDQGPHLDDDSNIVYGELTLSAGPTVVTASGAATATSIASGVAVRVAAGGSGTLVTNPNAETDTSGFTATQQSGPAVITRLTGLLGIPYLTGVDYAIPVAARGWSVIAKTIGSAGVLTAGETYTLSFYARALSGTPTLNVAIRDLNAQNQLWPGASLTLTSEWQRFSYAFTAQINSLSSSTVYLNPTDNNNNSSAQYQLTGFVLNPVSSTARATASGAAVQILRATGAATAESVATGSGTAVAPPTVSSASGAAMASSTSSGAALRLVPAIGGTTASSVATGSGLRLSTGSAAALAEAVATAIGSRISGGTGAATAASVASSTGSRVLGGAGVASASSTAASTGSRPALAAASALATAIAQAVASRILRATGGSTAASSATGTAASTSIHSAASTASSTASASASRVAIGLAAATVEAVAAGAGHRVQIGEGSATALSSTSGTTLVVVTGQGVSLVTSIAEAITEGEGATIVHGSGPTGAEFTFDGLAASAFDVDGRTVVVFTDGGAAGVAFDHQGKVSATFDDMGAVIVIFDNNGAVAGTLDYDGATSGAFVSTGVGGADFA